jgi:hypothetical protein
MLVAALATCGCDLQPDCVAVTCALKLAVTVNVTSAAGGPIDKARFAFVNGTMTGGGDCAIERAVTVCRAYGFGGVYDLQLKAAGFEDKSVSVAVAATENRERCYKNCPNVQAQQVDVTLTPK